MRRDRRNRFDARKALVLTGILALCCAVALPLYASQDRAPAHVDEWNALWNSNGLDVRDARNRPVSRAAIRREVRAGTVGIVRHAAGLSRVPALMALIDYIDRLSLHRAALRDQRSDGDLDHHDSALKPQRKPKIKVPAPAPAGTIEDHASDFFLTPMQLATTPGRVRVLNLLR